MPGSERDAAYLWDMLDAALSVADFVRGKSLDGYLSDKLMQAGVERKLQVLGEAARNASEGLKAAHPEIRWKSVVGLRNVLTHEYRRLSHERLFEIASEDIPKLIEALEKLVPPAPDTG